MIWMDGPSIRRAVGALVCVVAVGVPAATAQAPRLIPCEDERLALTYLVRQITNDRNELEFALARERARLHAAIEELARLKGESR